MVGIHRRAVHEPLEQAQALFDELNCGSIVSVTGRYLQWTVTADGIAKSGRYNAITRGERHSMPNLLWRP